MLEINHVYNMDCIEGMKKMGEHSVDIVLTSPPYNTGRNSGSMENHEKRYDIYLERKQDYIKWTVDIFKEFSKIVKENGCILYNLSYGNENPTDMYRAINAICDETDFMIADTIIWKKKSALPNNVSSNKLTRICEFVFVFCRKNEYKTFKMNKQVKSYSRTGQKYYENIYNFIEAKNNDGSNSLNKATFSTDFVKKLLEMYSCSENDVILDPFMGTGTTANGCVEMNRKFIGFELSKQQCEYAEQRISEKLWGEEL